MGKVAPLQGNFSGGEYSPLMFGRTDSDRYKIGLGFCYNMVPTLQGPVTRRPGTKFVAAVKNSAKRTRLIRFKFSITQTYQIEVGDFYFRVYANYGQVESSPGVPLEGFLPYSEAQLSKIKFTQSDDVLYMVHPDVPPVKLQRFSNTSWEAQFIYFQDGPYISEGTLPYANSPTFQKFWGSISFTPSGVTGDVTLIFGGTPALVLVTGTANNGNGEIRVAHAAAKLGESGDSFWLAAIGGTVEANGGWKVRIVDDTHFDLIGSTFVNAYTAGGNIKPLCFKPSDAGYAGYVQTGRLIRYKRTGHWYWARIKTYNSGISVVATVLSADLPDTVPENLGFRFGLWSGSATEENTGYPSSVVFHENRLVLGGTKNMPMRIDGSNSADYENFAPTNFDGTIVDSNAFAFTLVSEDVNAIRWMTSDERGLPVGTDGAEWVLRPSILNEPLTATNALARKLSNFGSADVQAVLAGKSSIFIQRTLRKIRELSYFYDVDGFKTIDATVLAEHITQEGISAELTFQKSPQPIVWTARTDGELLGMTFDRDLSVLKAGWHHHALGGSSDAAGSVPIVESVSAMPSPDGSQDDVWMIVKRRINGATVRYIEYMTRVFEGFDLQENAYFVDCGITFDNPITITAISQANPCFIACATGTLANGDKVVLRAIKGMSNLNYKKFKVANKTGLGFDLHNYDNTPVDSTTFSAYVSGGKVRKLVSTITGLTWLEGETVGVFADGGELNDKVVTGGAITLEDPSGTVSIGCRYQSDVQLLRIDAGSQNGTSLGKTRRTNKIALMLYRTLGIKIGTDPDRLDAVQFPTSNDQYGLASPLFSGIKSEIPMPADSDTDNQIWIRQDTLLPFTLQAVMPIMTVEDAQ